MPKVSLPCRLSMVSSLMHYSHGYLSAKYASQQFLILTAARIMMNVTLGIARTSVTSLRILMRAHRVMAIQPRVILDCVQQENALDRLVSCPKLALVEKTAIVETI